VVFSHAGASPNDDASMRKRHHRKAPCTPRGEVTHHGIAFFEFDPKTKRVRSARFFWNV